VNRFCLVICLVAALPGSCTRTPEPAPVRSPFRNVVLISIDTLRPDRLGCYGGAPTPTLDAIARAGAIFRVAVTPAPSTRAAHASVLTGVYPCVHGVSDDPATRLPVRVMPLAEILRGQGYMTAAVTEGGELDEDTFGLGFESFAVNAGGTLDLPAGRVEDGVAAARAWLTRHADGPFFLFLHTYQPHAPYTPPAPYGDAQGTDADRYAGEVRYTDAALGPLFTALDTDQLRDHTILVVTSDHGEAFGEHQHQGHGELYDEDIRVPFLWWAPGLIPAGRQINVVAGGVDIAPTVLALLGIPIPPWMQGRDLRAALFEDPPRVAGTMNMVWTELPARRAVSRRIAVRGIDWKGLFSWPYAHGGKVFVNVFKYDPHEEHPQDVIYGDRVSWIPPLDASCRKSADMLERTTLAGTVGTDGDPANSAP